MLPPLPLEIWTKILSCDVDPRYLPRTWLNCRRVSRAFKAATEMAFVDVYLPRMTICVELSEMIELVYGGLSVDRQFVTLKQSLDDQDGAPSRISESTKRQWREQLSRTWTKEHYRYVDLIQKGSPSILYHIWLEGYVEDPGFPDLSVDIEKRTLAFRWKPMLSNMFGEIEYRKWFLRKDVERGNSLRFRRGKLGQLRNSDAARVTAVELHVRRIRLRNGAWDLSSTNEKRQTWQVSALQAFRSDDEMGQGEEQGWGTFYDEVRPRFPAQAIY
ncbi:hypothetical protein TruAng_001706 [Truncatella angustata]|nr:hypothetical protein TruAng_001706 [Truncatella angustata]